ncbi:hypothetical protein RDV78_06805 [Bacillota bacterium LX-D]|nr:hypothetical protein [Bacillota bacterium LX-D]
MKRVFILGAGASKAGGIPALKDILSCLMQQPKIAEFITKIFKADLHTTQEFLPGVDDLYSLIDFALYHDHHLGDFTQDDLRELRRELNLSICRLFSQDSHKVNTSGAYEVYRKFAEDLVYEEDAVLTLNWDTALDKVLSKELGWQLNYGIEKKEENSFPLLKLHGSINWLWCENCSQFSIKDDSCQQEKMACPTCQKTNLSPLIVGPTVLPRHKDTPLENGWMTAMRYLISAERIYFIGLSLDAIDLALFELVKRGTMLNSHNPQIFVIGHGLENEEFSSGVDQFFARNQTVQRYIQLFGPQTAFYMYGFAGPIPQDEEYVQPYSH